MFVLLFSNWDERLEQNNLLCNSLNNQIPQPANVSAKDQTFISQGGIANVSAIKLPAAVLQIRIMILVKTFIKIFMVINLCKAKSEVNIET